MTRRTAVRVRETPDEVEIVQSASIPSDGPTRVASLKRIDCINEVVDTIALICAKVLMAEHKVWFADLADESGDRRVRLVAVAELSERCAGGCEACSAKRFKHLLVHARVIDERKERNRLIQRLHTGASVTDKRARCTAS